MQLLSAMEPYSSRDGIRKLVTDLDINDLYRSREAGSVTPLMDRRRDLFELKVNLGGRNP